MSDEKNLSLSASCIVRGDYDVNATTMTVKCTLTHTQGIEMANYRLQVLIPSAPMELAKGDYLPKDEHGLHVAKGPKIKATMNRSLAHALPSCVHLDIREQYSKRLWTFSLASGRSLPFSQT
jgi:hypothetical protein